MVGGLPKSHAKTEEDTERLAAAQAQCARIADRLAVLVDRDSEAYDMVVAAYRIAEGKRRGKAVALQADSGGAARGDRSSARCHARLWRRHRQGVVVAELGNETPSSDVQVGLELLRAALRGARLNVEVNLGTSRMPATSLLSARRLPA